jgi:hypothetical protein
MIFSSYPGVVTSTDDYYVMDSGLVVTETTISMLTDEPFDKLDDSPKHVPDFVRIMVANRMAKSARDWVSIMNETSTGLYDSQWMVVDYKRFKNGVALNGTFYVLEQVPGVSHFEDQTEYLKKHGYWGSYNRPWYPEVRKSMDADEVQKLHGRMFSRDKSPRANIFRATAPKVMTLADMAHEMVRNKWPHEIDGGDGNTPDHAIAARSDLDKFSPDPNGAGDAKITNMCLAKKLMANAISGPTHENEPVFEWTPKLAKQWPTEGLPRKYNFSWMRMSSTEMKLAKGQNNCDAAVPKKKALLSAHVHPSGKQNNILKTNSPGGKKKIPTKHTNATPEAKTTMPTKKTGAVDAPAHGTPKGDSARVGRSLK